VDGGDDDVSHTLGTIVFPSLALWDSLEPASLHAVETTLAVYQILPTEVNRPVGVAETDAPSSSHDEHADEEK
jgi:hypothetical protein